MAPDRGVRDPSYALVTTAAACIDQPPMARARGSLESLAKPLGSRVQGPPQVVLAHQASASGQAGAEEEAVRDQLGLCEYVVKRSSLGEELVGAS